ncbi:sodium/glutamate symporter [Peptococcus simiae]|uniref:sodium/glutamate symporter n=1 Tax=Peptococcus simiae TaxID=1643805 RepID=UPI003981180C
MVTTFSWVGIMLLVGVVLRALVRPLGNILMPASVIGGIVGFVLMNIGLLPSVGVSPDALNNIVGVFFIFTFISMGLTNVPKEEGVNANKEAIKGSIGMGCIWNMLYAIQPFIGYGVLLLVGGFFSMAPEYGMLIPFGFDHGPGQAATFGAMVQEKGLEGAQQVAITYAVLGFLLAFGVGVPLARYGIKKGLASYPNEIDRSIKKGLYKRQEQAQAAGMITTYNGNIDSLAFCIALMGLCYVIAVPIGDLLVSVPNQFVQIFGSMTFFIGMFVAYGVRYILNKFDLKQYFDDGLQTRVTGFTTDFMITSAFMAVQLSVVGKWFAPIIITALVVGLITFGICWFFSSRIGGHFDFERLLGIWGCATGTCPSGIALIRIVDPQLRTTVSSEMGSMNAVMFVDAMLVPLIISFCGGGIQLKTIALWFLLVFVASLLGSVLTGNVKRKSTYSLVKGQKNLDVL